jgi:elongation factor P
MLRSVSVYSVADLRPGQAIELEGAPFLVLSAQFSRKSQGKANCVTKIRNLKTNAVVQKTFIGSEKISQADVGYRHIQFLYKNDDLFTFMDLENYDQFDLSSEIVGDAKDYLKDGLELDALVFDEKPIAIKLPVTVDLAIIETMPGVRGDTATGGTKPAKLETGVTVSVPLFLSEGDKIKVNTETGEYRERA